MNKVSILARIILSSLMLNGCSSVAYISHTTSGHLELMSKRQKIETLLNDQDVSLQTREELSNALKIRAYASDQLALPDNNSYLSFVSLERDYVSWVVYAAPEFSLQPIRWCFWIVGCIPYRGYFSQDKAQDFSQSMQAEGYETYVAPVPAYSTLGWFDDPLLSSMLKQGEVVTASYIFHELAHQQVYIPDDTGFNEAFASAVAEIGVTQWLQYQDKPEELIEYQWRIDIRKQVYVITDSFRKTLNKIYDKKINVMKLRDEKNEAFVSYRSEIKSLVKDLHGSEKYSDWLLKGLNNAKLNAMSTYQELVPAFKLLFERCNNNFEIFYEVIASTRVLNNEQRRQYLNKGQCVLARVDDYENGQG